VLETRTEAEARWRAALGAVVRGEAATAEQRCASGSMARTLWESANGLIAEAARAAGVSVEEAGLMVDCEQERVVARRTGALPEGFGAALAERLSGGRRPG
jgi:hypothetical protein